MLHISNILVLLTGLLMSLVILWLLEYFKLVPLKAVSIVLFALKVAVT